MGRHAGWIAAAGGLAARQGRRRAAHHPVSRRSRSTRTKFLARVKETRREVRLLRRRRLRRRAATPTASSSPTRARATRSATRSSAASRRCIAQLVKDEARLQVPLGGRRLPAARRAPHRLEDRRRAGLRASARPRSSSRSKGQNAVMPTIVRMSRHARTAGRSAWRRSTRSPTSRRCMPRDFITADGFGITADVPPLPRAADRGRGLPALQGRPAAVRDAEERAGAQEARARPLWYSSAPFLQAQRLAQAPRHATFGTEIL